MAGFDLLFSSSEGERGEELGRGENKCPAGEASQHSYITSSSNIWQWSGEAEKKRGSILLAGLVFIPRHRQWGITLQDRPLNLIPPTSKTKLSKMVLFDSVSLYQCLHFAYDSIIFLHCFICSLIHPGCFCCKETDFMCLPVFVNKSEKRKKKKLFLFSPFSGWPSCVVLPAVYQQWATWTRGV